MCFTQLFFGFTHSRKNTFHCWFFLSGVAGVAGHHTNNPWTKSKAFLGTISDIPRARVGELVNPEPERPLSPHWVTRLIPQLLNPLCFAVVAAKLSYLFLEPLGASRCSNVEPVLRKRSSFSFWTGSLTLHLLQRCCWWTFSQTGQAEIIVEY